ncbi:MAG: hypothetical protein HY698_17660 [Deltaproteobacteria bacterium]|nr:hypothetical protein [Deltaproteobacteria bacterium]
MTASRDLAPRNDHLAQHRGFIVGRALATGLIGLVPVPALDHWLESAVRRSMIRHLAESRRVDLDDAALRVLADGKEPPPKVRALARASTVGMLLKRAWRKAVVFLAVAQRGVVVTRTFAVGTLFDHYCTRIHVGPGLTEASGSELRDAIDRAIAGTPARFLSRVFRRGLAMAARALWRAPFEVLDAATGGTVRRLIERGDEAAAEEVVDSALTRAETEPQGFLTRATRATIAELAHAGDLYVSILVDRFERTLGRKP